nr:Chain B, E3.18 Disulfide constrained peptide [synthetic construct]
GCIPVITTRGVRCKQDSDCLAGCVCDVSQACG